MSVGNNATRRYTRTFTVTLAGLRNLIYSPITNLIRVPYVGHGIVNTVGTISTTSVTLTKIIKRVPTSRIVSTVTRINGTVDGSLHRANVNNLTNAPANHTVYRVIAVSGKRRRS